MQDTFMLTIISTKDGKVLIDASGISEVCAYNLIKLYGNKVILRRENNQWEQIGKK